MKKNIFFCDYRLKWSATLPSPVMSITSVDFGNMGICDIVVASLRCAHIFRSQTSLYWKERVTKSLDLLENILQLEKEVANLEESVRSVKLESSKVLFNSLQRKRTKIFYNVYHSIDLFSLILFFFISSKNREYHNRISTKMPPNPHGMANLKIQSIVIIILLHRYEGQ